MPGDKYIEIKIDNQNLELGDINNLNISTNYSLEDRENFQSKTGSTAFDVIVPATVKNDQIANTYHNTGVQDLTSGEIFKVFRKGLIKANGVEILPGKAILIKAAHTDKPVSYEWNFYGHNADWLIDLKDTTLYDFVKDITFTFTQAQIIASWNFDGTDINLPYVFAPVRYGQQMNTYNIYDGGGRIIQSIDDYDMRSEYMKPALSKYWVIYKMFKSLGYTVKSDFLDTPYFRRQVMPWTWGNFLFSDGTKLDNLDFLAKSNYTDTISTEISDTNFTGFWDLKVDNDSSNGGFDNQGVYTWDSVNFEGKWTYLSAFSYGTLSATFHLQIFLDMGASANSDAEVRVQYFKNGVRVVSHDDNGNGTELKVLNAPAIGHRDFIGLVDDWFTSDVDPGDIISFKIYAHTFKSGAGSVTIKGLIEAFELDYFRVPLGGTIDFSNYTAFKKYKALDFLGGVIDEFNLCIGTDPINKVIYLEPQHPYSLVDDQSTKTGGYFNGHILDWSTKQDLSKSSEIQLFSDYNRELNFKYKDDNNDGSLKVVQDRHVNTLALAKYVFPDRFKQDKADIENRFFSVVMHYDVVQWKGLGSDPNAVPQMICMIPENISNTSRSEAENTFEPKSAYYKGLISNVGWFFDGVQRTNFPFMFAVNYTIGGGGEDDPILSYCDESLGDVNAPITGKGLLRRFFLQRLEIMRNGQFYKTWFHLNNKDIANFLHREHIICQNQKWEIISIEGYKPLEEESTQVYLRKWTPIRSQ